MSQAVVAAVLPVVGFAALLAALAVAALPGVARVPERVVARRDRRRVPRR